MKKTALLSKYTAVLTDTAMISIALVTLTSLGDGGQPLTPPVWLWGALAALLCAADTALSRRGMGASRFALVNGAFLAVFLFLIILTSGFSAAGGGGKALLILGVCVSLGRIVLLIFTPAKPLSRTVHFDFFLFFAAWYLLCASLGASSGRISVFVFGVFVLNIVSAAMLRAVGTDASAVESGGAAAGIFTYAGAAVVVAGASLGIAALFGRTGAAVMSGVAAAIKAFFKAVGGALNRFMLWLASLMGPMEDIDPGEPPPAGGGDFQLESSQAAIDPVVIKILIAVGVAAVIAVIILLLLKGRGKRLRLEAEKAPSAGAASRGRIKGGFARWLDSLKARIAFFAKYQKNKNTPQGLLIWLENRGRRSGKARLPGETMTEFIARLDVDGALSALGPELDRCCYGGGKAALGRAECRAMKHSCIKAARAARRRSKHEKMD